MNAIRIRPRADDERFPWNVDVDYGCQWPDCEWRNGFLVVERDGVAVAPVIAIAMVGVVLGRLVPWRHVADRSSLLAPSPPYRRHRRR